MAEKAFHKQMTGNENERILDFRVVWKTFQYFLIVAVFPVTGLTQYWVAVRSTSAFSCTRHHTAFAVKRIATSAILG